MSRPTWLFSLLLVFCASACAVQVSGPDGQDPGESTQSLGDAPAAPAPLPDPQQARVNPSKPTPDPWGTIMDPVKPTPDPWRSGAGSGQQSGSSNDTNGDSNNSGDTTQQSGTATQAGH